MTMDPAIVCGAISAIATLLVCLINNRVQHTKTVAIIELKIDELTKTVEKHNKVVERTYKLEETATLYGEKFKSLDRRLDALEKS